MGMRETLRNMPMHYRHYRGTDFSMLRMSRLSWNVEGVRLACVVQEFAAAWPSACGCSDCVCDRTCSIPKAANGGRG